MGGQSAGVPAGVMTEEIQAAINSLKKNRSPGIDNISAEELQAAGQSGVDVMFQICRKIWEEEKFPQMWKQSIIVPLFKKKDKLCCDNYRGVSLLSHCGKVMTSVFLQRIRQRTEQILSEAQAGFRARKEHNRSVVHTETSSRSILRIWQVSTL